MNKVIGEQFYRTATPDDWCRYINDWAERMGWNDGERRPAEQLALMHSELSEALEEYRKHGVTEIITGGKPEGYFVELADCVIRIMHEFAYHGVPLNDYLRLKMEYNETREYRHGGKKL